MRLAQIVNDEQLMLVHPAGNGDQLETGMGPGLSASREPIIASPERSAAPEDSSGSNFRNIRTAVSRTSALAKEGNFGFQV
jgi:hypothetical protein